MKFSLTLAAAALLGLATACSKDASPAPPTASNSPAATTATAFAYGADTSWMTQMEAEGKKFYNNSGTQQDLLTILKGKGITAVRLRVWVNPSGGWCNTNDLVAKAKRATAAGLGVMVDFHYSDVWADPAHQTKPAAWAGQTTSQLYKSVYDFTLNTLNTLKTAGVTPTWVQIGNETSDGMLWQDGRASVSATNFQNFAYMINSGRNAAKAVFPATKVIVHIANGENNTTARWLFDGLRANGANWDVCGFSVYPSTTNWASINNQVLYNMQDMAARYGKEVMICEAGMSVAATTTCKSFLADLITKTKSVPGGLGVFYWEPEAYSNWQGYTMGAFDTTGRPTVAMDAFIH